MTIDRLTPYHLNRNKRGSRDSMGVGSIQQVYQGETTMRHDIISTTQPSHTATQTSMNPTDIAFTTKVDQLADLYMMAGQGLLGAPRPASTCPSLASLGRRLVTAFRVQLDNVMRFKRLAHILLIAGPL